MVALFKRRTTVFARLIILRFVCDVSRMAACPVKGPVLHLVRRGLFKRLQHRLRIHAATATAAASNQTLAHRNRDGLPCLEERRPWIRLLGLQPLEYIADVEVLEANIAF